MKRILVTGGAGFIGSHLCERLLEEGHRVICLDDLSTGNRQNVAPLARYDERWHFDTRDVCRPFRDDYQVDEVYHLACPASPAHYQHDPVRTALTCALGTAHALDLARASGARFLLASTSEVYGDPLEHPQAEAYLGNVSTTGPRACYDEGKRFAETLTSDYQRQYGVDVRIARIFNTYGPRLHPYDGRVVSNFIRQALDGEAVTVHGRGEQTRSFCYVDDTVEALVRLMAYSTNPGPVNIGNPDEITVLDLSMLVTRLCDTDKRMWHFTDLPQDDPKRRRPDISRARELLGWEPQVSIEEGLAHTIDYFRDLAKEAA